MQTRSFSVLVACSFLAACGGGGSSTSGSQSPTQEVSTPEPELVVQSPGTTPVPPNTAQDGTNTDQTPVTSTDDTTPTTDTAQTTGTTSPGTTPAANTPQAVVTPPPPPPPPEPFSFFALNTSSLSTSTGAGSLEQASGRITLADLSGQLSADGTIIILEGGGQITVLPSDQDHVALYQAEPATGSPSFGVYGQETDFTTFAPSGTATYNGLGTAIVQIIDDADIYDLTGNLVANVNFDTNLVDVAISGLEGQRTDGLSVPVQVSDAAQIGINGAILTGGTYAGGDASFVSSEIAIALSGAESVSSTGSLFGDAGEEIGGVFIIDDTDGSGNLLIQGQYIGE